ncbi:MAG: hypothetical protein ABT00_23480 [Bordetella sp. SCN 68-11]|nr:MAG: hypothetical protein ABT00_23480 [Bordetella sp. SCN 68-11]
MDFELEPELRMLRDAVRRFVERELLPLEGRYANEHDIPDDVRQRLQDKAKDLGFWTFDLPEEVGGGGIGVVGMCVVFEELARCNVPSFRAPTVLTPYLGPVLFHGSREQKEAYLLPVARGEKRTCFALTEPGAGSDPSGMRTTAAADGDHFVINGAKIFITGADKADFAQVFARTIKDGKELGISCFLVDRDTPGMRLGQSFELMSPDRPWELLFDNVRVPADRMVGAAGQGWDLAREFLDMGRLIHNERSTFGQPLAKRQAIQWMIADSMVELHAARSMVLHAAWRADRGLDYHLEASAVKLYADEMLIRVVDRAIQIHGGLGLSRELPLELMYRDARSRTITEGSSEMQRMIIASGALSGRYGTNRFET